MPCEDHYKPKGPDDLVPTDPVSVAVALADKIDTLVGFWMVDEKPTGSKDPYALRRAALGVIRILTVNSIRLQLRHPFSIAAFRVWSDSANKREQEIIERVGDVSRYIAYDRELKIDVRALLAEGIAIPTDEFSKMLSALGRNLFAFFADRLKVQLREQGARHDLVDAVFALEGQDDLLLIVRRVEALGKFLDSEDGRNLLAGYKRATNIIRIEEKKDSREYTGAPNAKLYEQDEERALAETIGVARAEAERAVAAEDFESAMRAMAKLRPYVDAFFDKVTVNVDDKPLRENRLKLLNEIRAATRTVADFSKIEG